MNYRVTGKVIGWKYLGHVEADTLEEAEEKAEQLTDVRIGLCHQCATNCEDAEIAFLYVEEVEAGS